MRVLGILVAALLCPAALYGQDRGGVSEELLGSVVKITSRAPGGQARTGTGFIVRVDHDLVYIATASHVVEGDAKPQVAFYHDKRRPVTAEIGALEGGDPKGLGYLIVRDGALAAKVKALNWSADRLSRGEDVLVIGFGQGQGEWGVIRGNVASISGSDIRIDGRVEEGNSGGPIIKDGSVAGMVTSMNQGFGIGKSGIIVTTTLAGWDVPVSTATSRATASATPSLSATPPPAAAAATTTEPPPSTARITPPPEPARPRPGATAPPGGAIAPPAGAIPSGAATAPAVPAAPRRVNVAFPNGDRYEGDVVGVVRTGQGRYVFANGDRYEGGFVDNRFNGKGVQTLVSGDSYDGEFRNGVKSGRGVFRYANGDRYEGEFVDNVFSGKGVLIHATGDRYEGEFRDSAKNGRGVHHFANGDRYEGEFAAGVQSGTGTYYHKNGDKYTGRFSNGVRNGKGVYTFANGETRATEFVNGVEKPR